MPVEHAACVRRATSQSAPHAIIAGVDSGARHLALPSVRRASSGRMRDGARRRRRSSLAGCGRRHARAAGDGGGTYKRRRRTRTGGRNAQEPKAGDLWAPPTSAPWPHAPLRRTWKPGCKGRPQVLHAACCTLHVACCMLHVACCMLHVARVGAADGCVPVNNSDLHRASREAHATRTPAPHLPLCT
jgi:hypothetical protein